MTQQDKTKAYSYYLKECAKMGVASDPSLFDFEAEIGIDLNYGEMITQLHDKFFDKLDNLKESIAEAKHKIALTQFTQTANRGNWELLSESRAIVLVGSPRCMPKGTLIKTKIGTIPIEKVKKCYSYNFQNGDIEEEIPLIHKTGKQQLVKIHTNKGVLGCSLNHTWIVMRDSKIQEIMTKDLKETDNLLLVTNEVNQYEHKMRSM